MTFPGRLGWLASKHPVWPFPGFIFTGTRLSWDTLELSHPLKCVQSLIAHQDTELGRGCFLQGGMRYGYHKKRKLVLDWQAQEACQRQQWQFIVLLYKVEKKDGHRILLKVKTCPAQSWEPVTQSRSLTGWQTPRQLDWSSSAAFVDVN